MRVHQCLQGQSAIEYLMVYGFALVVVVIAMAALSNVANPGQFQGNRCDIRFGGFVVSPESGPTPAGFSLVLINQTGYRIENLDIVVGGEFVAANNDNVLEQGEIKTFTFQGHISGDYELTFYANYDTPNVSQNFAKTKCTGSVS